MAPRERSERTTWRRRLLRGAVAVLAALAVAGALAVGLAVAVATGELPWATRALVEWGLSRALGAEVHVGRARGSLLEELTLRDVSVGGPPGEPLRVALVRVRPERLDLRSRRLALESIELRGLALRVRHGDEGWHLEGWPAAAPEAAPPAEAGSEAPPLVVSLHRLVLADATLELAWGSGDGQGAVRGGLDLEMDGLRWPPDAAHPWPERSEGTLRLASGRMAGRAFAGGSLALHQQGASWQIDAHGIEGARGRLDAEARGRLAGSLDAPGLAEADASLRVASLDLAALVGRDDLGSSLNGGAELHWADGELRGRAQLGPSRLGGAAIATAAIAGRLSTAAPELPFDVEAARLDADFARLDLSASGDLRSARALVVRRAEVELGALPAPWRPPALRGHVAARAELSGPWSDLAGRLSLRASGLALEERGPFDVVASGRLQGGGRARIEALEATLPAPSGAAGAAPLEVAALAPFEARWHAGGSGGRDGIEVRGARLRAAGGRLEIDGGASRSRLRDLRLGADRIDLSALALSVDERPLGGRLTGRVRLDGPLEAPGLEGELAWSHPRWGELAADRIALQMAPGAAPGRLGVHATLERTGSKRLALRAELPARGLVPDPRAVLGGPDVRAELRLHELEAGWIDPLLPEAWRRAGGTLDGALALEGPAASPLVEGELQWREPRWGDLAADRLVVRVEAPADPPALRAETRLLLDGREALRAELELAGQRRLSRSLDPLRDPRAHLDLHFDRFDVAWLEPLVGSPALRIAGHLDGALRFDGGSPAPTARGELALDGLRASGPPLPAELGPASGRLVAEGRVLRLRGLTLASTALAQTKGAGEARLRGQISWETPAEPDVELQLKLDRFAVRQAGVLEGLVDGDVEVAGGLSALRARGGLVLHHANVDLPDVEDPVLREIRVSGLPATGGPVSIFEGPGRSWLDRLAADVSLKLGDAVWLRGLGAELEIEGGLRVRKEPDQAPGLFGGVEVASGRFDFRGKWLRVEQGSAVFDGSPDPDPRLDAVAVHRVRDVTIRVHVFGRASDLKVELESDPPMSPEDQLSYLIFDRPVGELGASEQSNLGAAAGVLAADVLLGETGESLAQTVGVDRIRVGMDTNQAPTLEIEKQLHERLRVTYGRTFTGTGGDRFVVEWRLFRRLFLSGEQTTSGDSAVDLIWRYDY